MKVIHVDRSYEVESGPESATAEAIRIGTRNFAMTIRWKSAEDGRTPCLYVSICLFGHWFEIVNKSPKD